MVTGLSLIDNNKQGIDIDTTSVLFEFMFINKKFGKIQIEFINAGLFAPYGIEFENMIYNNAEVDSRVAETEVIIPHNDCLIADTVLIINWDNKLSYENQSVINIFNSDSVLLNSTITNDSFCSLNGNIIGRDSIYFNIVSYINGIVAATSDTIDCYFIYNHNPQIEIVYDYEIFEDDSLLISYSLSDIDSDSCYVEFVFDSILCNIIEKDSSILIKPTENYYGSISVQ